MSDTLIYCRKLKQTLPAIRFLPITGELGARIKEEISQQAWEKWLGYQTILINEYRLNLTDPKAKKFLFEQMEKFLFEDIEETPDTFKPLT